MKRISIFGATGSIGQSTLDLIGRAPQRYQVAALTGGRNVVALARDAMRFNAEMAVTAFPDHYDALKDLLADTDIQVAAGESGLIEAADLQADWIMSAIVGAAGLAPGLHALRHGTTLALANKESLVAAGPLLMETARKNGARILPVDSEHSALFQCLLGEDAGAVERVIITASGGAFRDWPVEKLASATPKQAATHPNWDMGQRITIDSASMYNKALEVIEAHEYFGFHPDQIEVVIHPQSIIHAMIGHSDGGIIAHLGPADMRHAIGYALHWPERETLPVDRLDFAQLGRLDFRAPDPARYPALTQAYDVMRAGGMMGAVFNGAKETALDGFIAGKIGFTDMARIVSVTLESFSGTANFSARPTSLDNVLNADHLARTAARALIDKTS